MRNVESQREMSGFVRWSTPVLCLLICSACAPSSSSSTPNSSTDVTAAQSRLTTTYGEGGKLEKLEYDRNNDGKPDTWGFMDGTRVIRVEMDENGDGRVDRWEFHRADAGTPAATPGPAAAGDPSLERVERATKFDGTVSRWEYFTNGALTRIEEDTDGDGKIDKWETYRDGTLATMSLDSQGRGTPDRRLVYAPDGSFLRMEADVNGTGTFQPVTP